MKRLISRTAQDYFVPRWIDPVLAEALELLPEYGTITLTLRNGQVQDLVEIMRSVKLVMKANDGERP